jgi:hypothetical protein
MNFSLGSVADSDFSLLGAMNEQEFIGAVDAAAPQEKAKLFRRMKGTASNTSGGSRREFEKRLGLLPADIQAGLANKSLQMSDTALYAVKQLDGTKRISMFRDDDSKVVGYSNVSSGKLEKGNIFCLYAIRLQYGVQDAPAQGQALVPNPGTVNFDLLPDFIRNGEFEFKANGSVAIPATSVELLNTKGNNNRTQNTLILDNPKIIRDQQTMEMNIEWLEAAPARAWMKLILIGSSIIRA